MKLTEQGETISDKYSLPALAHDNLEILLSSTLDATLMHTASRLDPPTLARFDEAMDCVSEHARTAYRRLVDDPGLPDFFAAATPVDELGRLNVGSRPSSGPEVRADAGRPARDPVGVRLDPDADGRAGLVRARAAGCGPRARPGTAPVLDEMRPVGVLREPARQRRDDAGQDGPADRRVLRQPPREPGLQPIFELIEAEHEITAREVLRLLGTTTLLARHPVLRNTLAVRAGYLEPLHHLQVELLAQQRGQPEADGDLNRALLQTVNGIAAGLRNTG